MFELSFRGERTYRAEFGCGLYRLVLPEKAELVDELEKRCGGGASALEFAPGIEAGELIWLPQGGGLISNLRVWENIVLPRWYHRLSLDEALEPEVLALVGRLLPHLSDAETWLHRTVGQLTEDERGLVGLMRVLVSPAPWILIEADWANALDSAQLQLSCAALNDYLSRNERVALVFGPDAQALNAMLLWERSAVSLDWTAV